MLPSRPRNRLLPALITASLAMLLAPAPISAQPPERTAEAAPFTAPAAAQASGGTSISGGASPNVVVVIVDDLGMLDNRLWRYLPNIRRTFVASGVRFTDFHGESPYCCPGRVGFLTGQHTSHHGVVRNDATLFDPSVSLATELQGEGYYTFLAGKYLNNYSALAPSVPSGWNGFHAFDENAYYDYTIWNNGSSTPEVHGSRAQDYSTDVVARKAVGEIRRAPAGRPLFAWISPFAPHAPTTPAPRHAADPACDSIPPWAPANYNEADVSDKPAYIRAKPLLMSGGLDLRAICRSLQSVDDLVGSVRTELASTGRLDNTIFVFTSDNGMNMGAHRMLAKITPHATQIPFLVSWPAVLGTTPRAVTERLQNIDFAPTICELTGCRMGPYRSGQSRPDGLSFADLLVGGGGNGVDRDAVLTQMPWGPPRFPTWAAVTTTAHSALASQSCSAALELGCRWHYAEYDTGEHELYDLSNGPCWTWQKGEPGDPCRLVNRAGDPDYAGLEAVLAARLDELRRD